MNEFYLLHTWNNQRRGLFNIPRFNGSELRDVIQNLQNSIGTAQIQNVHYFINPDEAGPGENLPPNPPKRYFNHFEVTGPQEFLVMDQDEITRYNVTRNQLTQYLRFPAERNTNAFNYARYLTLEFFFPQDKKVQVYNNRQFIGELKEEFNGLISGIPYANTSRIVEYSRNDLYFIDKHDNLYWYKMDEVLKAVQEGLTQFAGMFVKSNIWDFTHSAKNRWIFIATKDQKICRYQSGLEYKLEAQERVTVMNANHGILATSTMILPKNAKPGTIQNDKKVMTKITYYVHSQDRLKLLAPPFVKEGSAYQSNMTQKILLINLKKGMIMVGLPNFQICDFLFVANRKISPLVIDKRFTPLCHWTMTAFTTRNECSIFYGTMSGIFKLRFALP